MTKFYRLRQFFTLCAVLLLSIHSVFAIDSLANNQRSLTEALNPDGTLKHGINGSFNAQGFSLAQGKNGQPVFTAANDYDKWNNSASSYINTSVNAVVVNGTDIYVGGNGLYRWTGTQWEAVGKAINITVRAIAIAGTDLYIGGYFTAVGGVAAKSIAKWDGTSWSALGAGVEGGNGTVRAIAVIGNEVYAGGTFESAGGNTAIKYLAKWDGSAWTAVGTNMRPNSYISAVVAAGTDIYIGGDFTTMGTTSIKRIAKWDGSNWSALGTGMDDGSVNAIAISGNMLYAGGSFTSVGGQYSIKYLAKFDGTSWATFSSASNNFDQRVNSIVISGSNIYVGGLFSKAGSVTLNGIGRWDGTSWKSMGTGSSIGIGTSYSSSVEVFGIGLLGTEVYLGGNFDKAGGNTAYPYFAKWDGSAWGTLRVGLNQIVRAVAVVGTNVYVGGSFSAIAGVANAKYIAKWNGTQWSALGTGVDASVYAIAVSGSDLYVGGTFSNAGGVSASRIAKWNGNSWSALGTGVHSTDVNNGVNAIAVSGNQVYVGGGFISAGGNTAIKYLAKWDGSAWIGLGTGVDNIVKSIALSGNDLYVGGSFTAAGGDANIKYLAKWDGSTWSGLGSGVNNVVNTIALSGTDVYVGGTFNAAGGNAAIKYIAKWDGNDWSSLGTGVDATVSTIMIYGTEVFVGGYFANAGGMKVNNIAKWDGSAWSSMGTGTNSYVLAIGSSGANLYAGGGFSAAGDNIAYCFAFYSMGPVIPPDHTGAFVTIWDTDKLPSGYNVSFNTYGNQYEYYWEKIGDEANTNSGTYLIGANSSGQSLVIPQMASGTGKYKLYIKSGNGTFTGFQTYGHAGQAQALTTVESWGNIVWTNLMGAFLATKNLTSLPADAPNLSQVSDLSFMFAGAESFNQNIANWNVSNVSNMSSMFSGAGTFNQNLGNWVLKSDVNLTSMLNNSGLSAVNYGLTLKGWAENVNIPTGRTLGAIGLSYPSSAQQYRDILTGNKNWTINDGGVLPIKLLSFKAKNFNTHVHLNWQTASEQNNKQFILSRSADGQTFTELTRIAGAGNSSSTKNYSYTDRNPLSGANYYKLEQVDGDGTVNLVGVEVVNFRLSVSVVKVYPNPTVNEINLTIPTDFGKTTIKVSVLDALGRTVHAEIIKKTEGQASYKLNNSKLPSGQYIIRLNSEQRTESLKLLVK